MLKKIEENIERLLKGAIEFSDLKILGRWLKILCGLLSKELKNNPPNYDIINKLYQIIVDLAENYICLLESDDGEASIYLGPSIFEVLIKLKSTIIEYDDFNSNKSEVQPQLNLSQKQIESLEKIRNINNIHGF